MYRWCITSKMNKINKFKIKRLTWGKPMNLSRRDFMKANATMAATTAAGLTIPVKNVVAAESEIK